MEIQQQFSPITKLIADAKQRAYQAVNHELVTLYWNIGEYLHTQVSTKAWGKAVVKELADFIIKTNQNSPHWGEFSPTKMGGNFERFYH